VTWGSGTYKGRELGGGGGLWDSVTYTGWELGGGGGFSDVLKLGT